MIHFADCVLENDAVKFNVTDLGIQGDIDMRQYKYFSKDPYERLFIYEFLHNKDESELYKIFTDVMRKEEDTNINVDMSVLYYILFIKGSTKLDDLFEYIQEEYEILKAFKVGETSITYKKLAIDYDNYPQYYEYIKNILII